MRYSGIWNSPDDEKYRYRLRLSPDLFPISPESLAELKTINELMYQDNGFLRGSVSLYTATANPKLSGFPVWGFLSRSLRTGIPKNEINLQQLYPNWLPSIIRLDLAERSDNPLFQIMEVEGDKTHAFGYSTIADFVRDKDEPALPGIAKTLARSLDNNSDSPVLLIVGQQERFYEPELNYFCKEATSETGRQFIMVPEKQLKIDNDGLYKEGEDFRSRVLVNLPILTPFGPSGTGVDQESILEEYRTGKLTCLIPPKRFLGNKALLGIISNCDKNPEIEMILRQFFQEKTLDTLRRYIPNSSLIWKSNLNYWQDELSDNPELWVVKQTTSSGMKGVALPDNPQKQKALLEEASTRPGQFIVQRRIEQKKRKFNFSEPENLNQTQAAIMYTRVELFASLYGIAAILVTARENPAVHGAPDAIQISVKLEGSKND